MARSFSGTDLVATGNVVSFANAAKGFCFWSQLSSLVTNSRFIVTSSSFVFQCFYSVTNNRIEVQMDCATTNGDWAVNSADHGLDLTHQPFFFAFSWDGTGSPAAYMAVQGAASTNTVTVTQLTAPVGAASTDATVTVQIGNKGDGSLPLNGWMEYVHVFDRAPSKADFDAALLASNSGIAAGTAAGIWQLDSSSPATDLSGNAHDATVTGTSVVTGVTLFTPDTSGAPKRIALLGCG